MALTEGESAATRFYRVTHGHLVTQKIKQAELDGNMNAVRTAAAKALIANGEPARAAVILRRMSHK